MYEKLLNEWSVAMDRSYSSGWFKTLKEGKVTIDHYVSYLVETFHHAGLNPQLQVYATMYFKGNPRELIKKFYQHAISEIGHDLLALNDAVALGANKEKIERSRPLASTVAYNSYPFFQIHMNNVLGYIGYLFHLEHLPTRDGNAIIGVLKSVGVSDEAFSFLEEHASVDVAHNKMMRFYVNELVKTDADVEEVIGSLRDAVELHSNMLSSALTRAENPSWKSKFF